MTAGSHEIPSGIAGAVSTVLDVSSLQLAVPAARPAGAAFFVEEYAPTNDAGTLAARAAHEAAKLPLPCGTCGRPITLAEAVAVQVGSKGDMDTVADLFLVGTRPVADVRWCSWACWMPRFGTQEAAA